MTESNFVVNRGITIKALSGNSDEIIIVGSNGEIEASGLTIADISGGINIEEYVSTINGISGSVELVAGDGISISGSGQQIIISSNGTSSGLQGRYALNNTDKIYTINHPEIDPNEEYPVVSLDIPTSGSDLFVQGVFDRQPESFKVELSGIPNSSYGILWHISTQETITTSGGFIPLEGNGIVITPSGEDYIFSVDSDIINQNNVSHFDPLIITSDADGINVLPGPEYSVVIQKAYGNLIAIDADVGTYDEIEIGISSEWTTYQVGTFRLDLDVKSGQTFTFDNSIEGIADVTLPDISGAASLLFDKPYGTSTWYVRQNI